MPSKDQRPKTRLGKSNPRRVKIIFWIVGLSLCGGGVFAAYRYTGSTEVEVAVARVRRADFIISVRTRGDIKSAHSTILKAPQVPGLRIVHLADNGRPIKKGEVVVEFDGVQQEQNVISRTTAVRAADGDYADARDAYAKVAPASDAGIEARERIITSYEDAGDHDTALALARELIKVAPGQRDAQLALADALRGKDGEAPFGPRQEVPAGATAADKVAAFMGRQV